MHTLTLKQRLQTRFIMLLILAIFSNASNATSTWLETVNFNSFFSIDATYTNKEISIVSTSEESRLYEPDQINLKNSIVGTQLDFQLTENFSGFIQGSVHFNNQDELDQTIDWAYLSYDWGSDLTTRFGKLQIPFLHGTELRKVGYARLWARPLIPSNGASGYKEYIGAEVLKSFSYGENFWTFQLAIGEPEHGLDLINGKQMALFSSSYQNGGFWLRTALMRSNYAMSNANGQRISDNSKISMGSVEVHYTSNNIMTNIGYSTSRSDLTPDDTMTYLSIAYQFDTVSPFIFTAHTNQYFSANQPSQPPMPPMNPPVAMTPQPNGNSDKYNVGLGIKWNFSDNFLIKAQFENVKNRDNTRAQLGLVENESNVLSILIEGVY